MNSLQQNLNSVAAELWNERQRLGEQLADFARKVCETIKSNPEIVPLLIEAGFSSYEIANWEKVGRGLIHEKIAFATGRQYRLLQNCSLSEQTQAITNGIEVLEENGDTRNIQVEDLSPLQCRQVFAARKIRSIAAQRTWLNEQRFSQPAPIEIQQEFKVTKGKLHVLRPCIISKRVILQLIKEI